MTKQMTKTKDILKKISDLQDQAVKIVEKYNLLSKENKHEVRLVLIQAEQIYHDPDDLNKNGMCKDYWGNEMDPNINFYISKKSIKESIIPQEAYSWLPSKWC